MDVTLLGNMPWNYSVLKTTLAKVNAATHGKSDLSAVLLTTPALPPAIGPTAPASDRLIRRPERKTLCHNDLREISLFGIAVNHGQGGPDVNHAPPPVTLRLFIKEWGHGALDEPPCPLLFMSQSNEYAAAPTRRSASQMNAVLWRLCGRAPAPGEIPRVLVLIVWS
jgi:hypothetical protein